MTEYDHLIQFYGNNHTIGFTTFNTFSAEDKNRIKLMLKNIHAFERPDMYSKVGNDVYIIEHFAFDASKRTRNGMSGIKEENALEQRISDNTSENEIIDKAVYSIDKKSFQKNFEDVFEQHYKKVDNYIENLKINKIIDNEDKVHFGMFVENIYPPLYEDWGNGDPYFSGELLYFSTKQFYDFLESKDRLSFILFGCIYNQSHQLFYVNPSDRGGNLIDLENDSIVFSKLNGNEMAWTYSL